MRKSSLSAKEISALSQMILDGKSNNEIAEQFKVSTATVNNHRTRLKREGANVPKGKRGRKPGSEGTKVVKKAGRRGRPKGSAAKAGGAKTAASKSAIVAAGAPQKIKASVKMENYVFNINGVSVTVSGKTKAVHIGTKEMTVQF